MPSNSLSVVKPLLRKSTLCCFTNKSWIFGFVLLLSIPSLGQQTRVRNETIESQILELASTTIPGLNETASISVSKISIQDFLRGLAETHNLNISVDPALDVRITNNFTNVKVIDLIAFIAREYELNMRLTGNIITFYREVPPPPPKAVILPKRLLISYNPEQQLLSAELRNDSLFAFAKHVTQLTKSNIVLAPNLTGRLVTAYFEELPLEAALEKIAFANNLKVGKTNDNAFLLQEKQSYAGNGGASPSQAAAGGQSQGQSSLPRELEVQTRTVNGGKLLDVNAVNIPISQLLHEVSVKAGLDYVVFSEPQGNTTVRVKQLPINDFLTFVLQGTTHTFKVSEGIYSFGDRNLEGFRNTKVVRMQFRPVDKLDEVIPSELKKGVEIKIFKELNSIIFSGGAPQIEEITAFLKAIDQPVTNVLIEVLVVELRKGKSVRAGLSAFLSDSTITTKGQIFSGVDMTIGSSAINDFLDKLKGNGVINLGKVTPNFYLKLEALEQNNYLDLKSTPKLSTLNGHEATLRIGQSVYYLEETQNISGGVTPFNTISRQYKQVSADLNIKINPMVSADDNITLDISAEFSDFIEPTIPGAPPGNATRKFTSMIRVRNEEMIVLGGLEEARKTKSGSGIPVLSRIPVIRWLFSSRNNASNDNKLIVFIKPTLIY
jgi:type IV pilus assembly protein PilQ